MKVAQIPMRVTMILIYESLSSESGLSTQNKEKHSAKNETIKAAIDHQLIFFFIIHSIEISSSYRAPAGTTRNPALRVTRYEELMSWFLFGRGKYKDLF